MTRIHANNFVTTLNGDISSGATSIIITSTTGFPAVGAGVTANITLANGSTVEIVTCTARSGTTLTVTRGAEGTTPASFLSGSTVSIRPTADSVDRKADLNSPVLITPVLGTPASGDLSNCTNIPVGSATGILPMASGGTNKNMTAANGGVAYSDADSLELLAPTATAGLPLLSGSNAAPSWGTLNGSGNLVATTSAALVTPALGTPTSGNLSNCTALPLTTGVSGTLPIANGGTAVTSVTTAPTASSFAGWDANSNLSANNSIKGYATTATAAGTTTLTVSSKYQQYFTGSTTQTVVMPVTSTLVLGQSYLLVNNSSGNVTVNASDSSLIITMLPDTQLILTCISISVTSSAAWSLSYGLINECPSLANTGITYTGGSATNTPLFVFLNESAIVSNVFYNDLPVVSIVGATLTGLTTLDLGNCGIVAGLNLPWSNLTSLSMPNVIASTAAFVLNTPSLTTFTAPKLITIPGPLTLTSTSLTSLSFPLLEMIFGAVTFTSSASLATVSMPNLFYIPGNLTGTLPSLTSLTLTNLLNIGNTTFAVAGSYALTANALTTLSMPALTSIATNFAPVGTSLATVSMPALITVGGTFSPTLAALTSLTLTNLTTVTGAFGLTAATLTTLSLPALTTLGAGFSPTCAAATTVTLTNLANITGTVAASFAALTTLSFPAIVSVSSSWTITAANLVTFSLGSTLKSIGGNFTMTGMKLDQASVDGILVSLAALDGTNGTTAYSSKTINLSGGTSSAPSATGLAAKATLEARSCTVTTN